jgi:nucleoside-diphosphate-sugar epimerase
VRHEPSCLTKKEESRKENEFYLARMILITGGNGVVGTRLALKLAEGPGKVRVLGAAPSESDPRLRHAGIEVVYGDVTRPEELEPAMRGADQVVHLAAVLFSPEDPARHEAVNAQGTRHALAAAERCGVRHFVFVSSISVLYPRRNAYSASKAAAEDAVRGSAVPWTIVRPCLVMDGLEYRAFENAVLRWPILFLPRRGAARKRPLRADALAEALSGPLGDPAAFGKTLALGGNEIVSLREMAARILRARGRRKLVLPVPEAWLRIGASLTERISRMSGRRISWLSHQGVDGLVFDAAPPEEDA